MPGKKKTPAKGGRIRTNSRPSNRKKTSSKSTPGYNTLQYGNALLNKRLKKWGITRSQSKKAGCKLMKPAEAERRTGYRYWALEFIYYDLQQKATDYYRARFLEEVKGPFGSTPTKPIRYRGPKNEPPRFYLPCFIDLAALATNVDIPIIITEGEACAIAAALKRLPCFAVPGVWAWRSKKHNLPSIKDFDLFKWKGRTVYLSFDNDVMSNPQVIVALNALAHELTMRGAVVVVKFLPKGRGKIDLNDYFKTHSVEQFKKLRQESYAESAELWKLNEEIAMVNTPNAAWEFGARRFLKTHQDYKNRFGDRIIKVKKADDSGFKEVSAIDLWQKWPEKRRYKDIVYRPGLDEIVDDCVNLWKPYPIEPKKGSVKPFHDLTNFLFAGEPELLTWFEKWLAYPLQVPGGKNLTAVLFQSRAQGVGKSFVGYIMREIYGENFVAIDAEALRGNFNGWTVNKQFILGEEITGNNSRALADRFKNMITRELIHVNEKYQPEYDIEDRANYLLTSNHVDALHLDDTDRRVVVIEIKGSPKPQSFYKAIDRWRNSDGPAHLFHYLLNDVDLSDYDPKAPAPMSAAKQRVIDFSKSDVDMFARDVRENPDAVLCGANIVCERDLYEGDAIQSFAQRYCDRPDVTKVAATKALGRVGIECRPIYFGGTTRRLWPLRNTDAWMNRPNTKWVEHYEMHTQKEKF